jgi:prolyl-tRNA editing enzyme YbaK/EbsC (Cys-tRNA(Pro) deacylase)
MAKDKFPGTQAIRALKAHAVTYTLRPYQYEEKGGTKAAAEQLSVAEHQIDYKDACHGR